MPKGVLAEGKTRLVLSVDQVNCLLEQIAEGKKYSEILEACRKFSDPFSPSPQHVQTYRNSRKEDLAELRKQKEHAALNTGLAVKANRVNMLQDLAERLYKDIVESRTLWLEDRKQVGNMPYDFEKFNDAELSELRGVLDDIAKETGGRITRVDVKSDDKPLKGYVGITPEEWSKKDAK